MPFQSGKIVQGLDFVGREKLLIKINAYLDMGQSVVLIAPRRYGKSSIIRKVINTRSSNKSIQIDLMKIYNKRDLAEAIIEETYKLVGISNFFEFTKKISFKTFEIISKLLQKFELNIEEIGFNVTVEHATHNNDDALLRHALELPERIAKKLGINILFAIDELGEIKNLKEYNKILSLMRSVFQEAERVNFIFAGSQYSLMNYIFTDKNSPFFRFAEVINVPTMNEKEFKPLFEKRFNKENISLYDGFTKDIIKIAGGIPYYIVKIAQSTFIDAKIRDRTNIFPYSVCRASLERYKQEEGHLIGELNRIKGKKYYIQLLRVLAINGDPYKELELLSVKKQNINKILIALADDGLILKLKSTYTIIDPFLKRYLSS